MCLVQIGTTAISGSSNFTYDGDTVNLIGTGSFSYLSASKFYDSTASTGSDYQVLTSIGGDIV